MLSVLSFKERKPIPHLQVVCRFLIFVNIDLKWWKVLITKQNEGQRNEWQFKEMVNIRTQQSGPPQSLTYLEFTLFHEDQEYWPEINCSIILLTRDHGSFVFYFSLSFPWMFVVLKYFCLSSNEESLNFSLIFRIFNKKNVNFFEPEFFKT